MLSMLVLIDRSASPGYGHDDSDHANTARYSHTATLLANGKVLVCRVAAVPEARSFMTQ